MLLVVAALAVVTFVPTALQLRNPGYRQWQNSRQCWLSSRRPYLPQPLARPRRRPDTEGITSSFITSAVLTACRPTASTAAACRNSATGKIPAGGVSKPTHAKGRGRPASGSAGDRAAFRRLGPPRDDGCQRLFAVSEILTNLVDGWLMATPPGFEPGTLSLEG
jgi:hypothetical protein